MEWKTSISQVIPNHIRIRGYPIGQLMENLDFGQAVYLVLKGELPTPAQGKMLNAVLVATIDHSVMAPSACATRFVASGGSPIQSAVAAGLQALGPHHGGAIEDAQILLTEAVKKAKEENKTIEQKAEETAQDYRNRKKRLPGYGHPYHKEDPRATKFFDLAEKLGFTGDHLKMCKALAVAAEKAFGRKLVINVDAAMAAILADMGFPWEMARGFFIISRSAGLVAHAFEEYTRERPFRAVPVDEVKYDGPSERNLQK
jgi:citrate synthase